MTSSIRRFWHNCYIACAVVIGVWHPSFAVAAEPAWPKEPYRYLVVDQDLRDVLTEFGRNAASVGGADCHDGHETGNWISIPSYNCLREPRPLLWMDLAQINHVEVHVLCCLTEHFGFRHPGDSASRG